MSKQWSSFTENQQHTDAWREYLNEAMDKSAKKARFGRPAECPPCPECPDDEKELEEVPIDPGQVQRTLATFNSLNKGLQLNLDDAAIMREYQQFLRDQKIIIKDGGKELDLSEDWKKELARQEKEASGEIVHHEGRAPKLGKLEDLEKYPNLYKLITAGMKSEKYKQDLLDAFTTAGFADVKEFAAASVQQQPEQQPEEQPEVPAEEPSPGGSPTAPGGRERRQPGMVVGDEKEKLVHTPKVQAHLKKAMGKDYDEKRVKLVLQVLSRLNKNPEIQFPEELQENIDLTAVNKMLKSKDFEDENFITKVMIAIIKTSKGIKAADFNKGGRPITGKPSAGAAANTGKAIKKGDTYEYTSGGGKKSVVRVLDPEAGQRDRTMVQQLNPETCNPVRQIGVRTKALTTPYDGKCTVPGTAEQSGEEEDMSKVPSAQLRTDAQPAVGESLDTKDQALLENWQKLAGIIKG